MRLDLGAFLGTFARFMIRCRVGRQDGVAERTQPGSASVSGLILGAGVQPLWEFDIHYVIKIKGLDGISVSLEISRYMV